MPEQWFSHSGDIGDIIYSLPAIRAKGGGKLILFDMPGRTAHGMSEAKVNRLRPLLESQDYISSVEWSPFYGPDHDLNGFRDHFKHGTLVDAHLSTQGLDWKHRVDPWIRVDPSPTCKVVIHRSERYHNKNFPWRDVVKTYAGDIGFIGFEDEHRKFCQEFGTVPRIKASGFLQVARIIAGSQLFIGNQSSPLAVAHGLKHDTVMEISPGDAQQHCVFQRMNCIIGWDEKIEWPELA